MPLESLGPYRLVKQLAVGGMAEIYMATVAGVEGFEKRLALKIIRPNYSADPEFVRMLVDEAKLAVQLQHGNIVQTFDLGHLQGTYYIAMELVDGADLFRMLRRSADLDRYLPFEVAAFVAREVAEGLDYAHRKTDPSGRQLCIIHRDISPQNVLISYAGEVKICDFGIAKAAFSDHHTAAGIIKGKYYYMSPEQASGSTVDARTDIFSAGILLYEMLVGHMLYLEEKFDKLLEQVRRADILPPSSRRPDIPAGLEDIAMRALRRNPAERYQTAAEFSHDLETWLHENAPDFAYGRLGSLVSELVAPGAQDEARPRVRHAGDVTNASANFSLDEHSLIFKTTAPGTERSEPARPLVEVSGFEDSDETLVDRRSPVHVNEQPRAEKDAQRRPALPVEISSFVEDETALMRQPKARNVVASPPLEKPAPRPAALVRPLEKSPISLPVVDDDEDGTTTQRPPAPPPAAPLAASAPVLPEPPVAAAAIPVAVRPPVEIKMPRPPAWSTEVTHHGAASSRGLAESPERTAARLPRDESGMANTLNGMRPVQRRRHIVTIAISLVIALGLGCTGYLLWHKFVQHGEMEVLSYPLAAEVEVDGVEVAGGTPAHLDGVDTRRPHRVKVTLTGYEPWERTVRFEAGKRSMELHVTLVKE